MTSATMKRMTQFLRFPLQVHATAAIMTLPSFVLGPQAVLDKLANAIGAVPDPYGYGLYLVECKNRTKLPPVKFNVGQRDIWIPQEDYVIGVSSVVQALLTNGIATFLGEGQKCSPALLAALDINDAK